MATGDVDGDGMPDILWQHTDGRVAVWYMDGWHYRFGEVFVSLSDPSWRVVGASDVNGDRRLDLIWHHATRGDVAVWFMAGRVVLDAVQVNESVPDTNWHIVAVSDLDRDGAPDLIWHEHVDGQACGLDARRCASALWRGAQSFGGRGHELENCGSTLIGQVTLTGTPSTTVKIFPEVVGDVTNP